MLLQWLLTPLAVLGACVLAGLSGSMASSLAGFWHLPAAGFSAAFAVVLVAYLAAPRHRLASALVALTAGALVAWVLLEPAFYPESYGARGAYQPSHLPLIATCLGGLAGLLASLGIRRWSGLR